MTTTINYSDPFNFDDPTVKRIIDRMIAVNRKLTPQDVTGNTTCRVVAEWYATQYNGTFEFMQSMHRNVQRFQLSASQIASILNCMYNDYQYAQRRKANTFVMPEGNLPDLSNPTAEQVADYPLDPVGARQHATTNDPITPVVLNGTYTVILNESGDYRTLRLTEVPTEKLRDLPTGTQYIGYLSGPNNDHDYTPCGYVSGKRILLNSKFKQDSKLAKALEILLTADRQRQIDMGESYALESGNCFICGRKLTVPASLHRGTGPICAQKYGIA